MSTLQDEETPVLKNTKALPTTQNAEDSWFHYEQTHPSIIDKLFTGMLQTTVTCGKCT